MRIDIKETRVFQFSELSESAKQTALEAQARYESEVLDVECVYDDAATIADLFGLDLNTKNVKLMGGGTRLDPCIYYSGFSSQGDGACFEGCYEYAKGGLKAVKEYAPLDTELHRIVSDLQCAQAINFYRITALRLTRPPGVSAVGVRALVKPANQPLSAFRYRNKFKEIDHEKRPRTTH